MEVGSGAAVDFVAREQVNGVLSGGVGGEFGSEIDDRWNGAGGEFTFGVAFADDNFGADVAFYVDDIAFVEGDGFGDAAGGVETDGKEGAISRGIYGEAFIKEELNLGDGEDFCLPVAVDLHGSTESVVIFIQPLSGGEGQAVRVKIQSEPEFEGAIMRVLGG